MTMTKLRARQLSFRALAFTASALFVAGTTGLAAQSAGPVHLGYDPTAPVGGHYHVGLTGEQWLAIERNIKCTCSCNLDTHSCQFQMQCGTSPGWSERIRRDLEAGQTAEAIQASFVADYGMQVLMAPPAEGFNLLGYFLPALTILAAGALIAVGVRANTRRMEAAPVREIDQEDAERLRAEWQKLDEAESPDW
jgi:cytochrome c-type biogenesis protein CcmH/NrfF